MVMRSKRIFSTRSKSALENGRLPQIPNPSDCGTGKRASKRSRHGDQSPQRTILKLWLDSPGGTGTSKAPQILRDGLCHASREELAAALTGNYREEQLFSLRQNFTAYQFHLQQIAECDAEKSEALLNLLAAQQPPPAAALPAPRAKSTKKHAPAFDIRTPPHVLTGGADLSQIHSIGP